MKKRTVWVAALCLLLCLAFFCSCGKGAAYDYDAIGKEEEPQSGAISYSLNEKDDSPAVDGRKIIRTVEETLETNAFDEFMKAIDEAMSAAGGYSGNVSVTGNGYEEESDRYARLTVYIPAENLDAFLNQVGNLGAVTRYEENTADVTEAYVDVTSRITVLEAEEKSLLAMLASAANISEMLEVRKQLTEVQEDLASLRAQKTSYDKRVAYSTVNMYVREVDYVSATGKLSFLQEVGDAFVNSLRGVLNFLRGLGIGVLGGSPYIVLFGGIGVGIFCLIRSGRKKKAEKREAAKKQNGGQP